MLISTILSRWILIPVVSKSNTTNGRVRERFIRYYLIDRDVIVGCVLWIFLISNFQSWPGYRLNEDRTEMQVWDERISSGLTMLLYLNGPADGVVGGNTRLYKRDGTSVDVSPVKGSALFFRHGFGLDSVRHVGCVVHGPVSKYVARINVMYIAP